MNAIEIRNLSKSFRGMYAVDHLNMTVPVGQSMVSLEKTGAGNPRLKSWSVDTLFRMEGRLNYSAGIIGMPESGSELEP